MLILVHLNWFKLSSLKPHKQGNQHGDCDNEIVVAAARLAFSGQEFVAFARTGIFALRLGHSIVSHSVQCIPYSWILC